MAENWVKVGTTQDLSAGNAKSLEINGQELALYNVDGKYYCTSNICPHQGGPMGDGMLEGNNIVCPWHAWVFDVTNGVSPVNPRAKLPCYQVKVENNDVFVSL